MPRLDTRNRLSLTGGTPDLRQSYTHSVSLGYYHTDTKSSRSVGFNLSADLTVRDIATRQRFFAEDTPLEQYGRLRRAERLDADDARST